MLRKSLTVILMVFVLAAPGMVQAQGQSSVGQDYQDYQTDQTDQDDQVLVDLLWMVLTDLQMCGQSLSPSAMNTVSAVGHLNNAQSALKKTQLGANHRPLVEEILTRIGKIKFYLVMQDFRSVQMRLGQLTGLVNNILRTKVGQGNYSNPNGYNPNGYYPNPNTPGGSGFVRPELPVGGGFGNGQNLPSVGVPGLPTTN